MTDPTERHMAEARDRDLRAVLNGLWAGGGNAEADSATEEAQLKHELIRVREVERVEALIHAEIAQAERRGAEAQRSADLKVVEQWAGPFSEAAHRIRTAPLATAAPEPAPAAEQAALALGVNVLKHYLETGPCGNFPERAVLESGLATDLPLELTDLGRRLVERGGRDAG